MHSTECCGLLKRAVAQDPVLQDERKTMYFADDIERAVLHSPSSEKQFATAPIIGHSGGATSSSDPFGSSSAVQHSQALGRGQKRTLPEDGVVCIELSST